MKGAIAMSTAGATRTRPFALVVGLDLTDTETSGYALDQAARVTARIPGSEMHVVHVASSDTSLEVARQAVGLLQLYVTEKAACLQELAQQTVGVHVRRGDAADEIARLASEVGADMIIVGAHKAPNLKDLLVGSTGARLMGTAKCPVLVAGPVPRQPPSHVIVIDPPCSDCLEARTASQGRTWWCARHSEHHHLRRHHVYSYQSHLPFAEHDSEVTATGV
jgi:nucleotide-binding universal stress UspA family protein